MRTSEICILAFAATVNAQNPWMPSPYGPWANYWNGIFNDSAQGNNCSAKFSADQCDVLFGLQVLFAVLSLLGLIFIVGTIIIHRTYRNFIQRLILWLTVAAIGKSVSYLFSNDAHEASTACVAQGFVMTLFDVSTLLWVCVVTHAMFLALIYSKSAEKYEIRYHCICWGCGLVVAIVPLAVDAYGPAGVWCWVVNEYQDLRFGIWYVPLYLILTMLVISNGYVFYLVNWRVKQWQGTFNPKIEEEKKFMKMTVQPLKWYPTVYVLASIFPLVNRIQNWANGNNPIYFLYVAHSISSTIEGVLNACIYFAMTEKKTWEQCTLRGIKRALKSRGTRVDEYQMQDNQAGLEDSDEDEDIDSDEDFEDIANSSSA